MAITKKTYQPSITVFEEPPELGAMPRVFLLDKSDFVETETGKRRKSALDGPYLLVGFDTEFKTPDYHVSRDEIVSGGAKYRVLSYQFHAKLSSGEEWQGIHCTQADERMSMGEFLVFVLGKGKKDLGVEQLPTTIFLVGHFTRADIPAFSDFKDHQDVLSSVRNTFLSIDKHLELHLEKDNEEIAKLRVIIRDTMLLTPQASKSLKELGKLVGFEKVELDPDPKIAKKMISEMDQVRKNNWGIYRKYALMDATICKEYIEKIIHQYENVTGKKKVPVTLTSIGVDLLLKTWNEELKLDYLSVLGKEEVKHKFFDKAKGHYRTKNEEVPIEEFGHHIPFITESYHGGRGEQFWFGPCFEDDWIDIDLASAYPTAMSIIGMPFWREIYECHEIDKYTPTTLGFVWVDFEFSETVRYPTLPVRTSNGLIFPRVGTSYCSSPELVVAKNLGAKLTIRRGVIVPTDSKQLVFQPFIRTCVQMRSKAGSKTLEGLFWKEISNSTYGKTAQGLHKKRVYDMRDRSTKPLPPSRITNPAFASFITSFVRGLLGEIINNIDRDKIVFSCTTDGFLTNFPEERMNELTRGQLAGMYAKARDEISGDSKILEIKHSIRQPLGWRTRGQATLKIHPKLKGQEFGIVLAKGGIFTKPESEEDEQQNQEIVELFFNRRPDSILYVESLTGIRDIVEHDADLVTKEIQKRLNMEYDWKRQPTDVQVSKDYNHIYFQTQPWYSVHQFEEIRDLWDEFTKSENRCIRTLEEFNTFADYIECRAIDPEAARYLKKDNPDINRLKILLCSAWQQSKAGLTKGVPKTANEFAEILKSHGISCKRTDVENGRKREFEPNSCPPTEAAKNLLNDLKAEFPSLDGDQFLHQFDSVNSVTIRPRKDSCKNEDGRGSPSVNRLRTASSTSRRGR